MRRKLEIDPLDNHVTCDVETGQITVNVPNNVFFRTDFPPRARPVLPPFSGFGKIPRWSRDIIITEKIDGTNAQVYITEDGDLFAGSRTRWITPENDNHGFARWCEENREDLLLLGPGQHFGEWWGRGIQRGYGLKSKQFSLFNVTRWADMDELDMWGLEPAKSWAPRPSCCNVVPILYSGPLIEYEIEISLTYLNLWGSDAAPGFMDPEGIVIYHTAGNCLFKQTLKDDEKPKGQVMP